MAAEPDSGSIIGNAIALAALIGGAILTAFAAVRSLLGAGRDAREARELSTRHSDEIQSLKEWRRERDERDRHILQALTDIKDSISRLHGGSRGSR